MTRSDFNFGIRWKYSSNPWKRRIRLLRSTACCSFQHALERVAIDEALDRLPEKLTWQTYGQETHHGEALILHWNGTAWKRVPSPKTGDARMAGVAPPRPGCLGSQRDGARRKAPDRALERHPMELQAVQP